MLNLVGQRARRPPVQLAHRLTGWQALTWSLAEGVAPWVGAQEPVGMTELSTFGAGVRGFGTIVPRVQSLHTGGVQEGATFSRLSPLTEGQVRDCTGLGE